MKTLLLQYEIRVEYRVGVADETDPLQVSRALQEALQRTGIMRPELGIIPESIRFSWEDRS